MIHIGTYKLLSLYIMVTDVACLGRIHLEGLRICRDASLILLTEHPSAMHIVVDVQPGPHCIQNIWRSSFRTQALVHLQITPPAVAGDQCLVYGVPTPTGYADQGESSWHHLVSCMIRVSAEAPDSPSKFPCMILDSARIRHPKSTGSPVSFVITAGDNVLLQHCALFQSAPECQEEREL